MVNDDVRLVLEIKNVQPVELLDLTELLCSLVNQFDSYISKNPVTTEKRSSKLYVKELKTGSIILDLVEYAFIGAIPFLENVNTVIGFAGYLKSAYNLILNKPKELPEAFSNKDCNDFIQIVNPIAKDNGSIININTVINGDVNLVLTLDSTQSNAAQNILKERYNSKVLPQVTDELQTKVLLSLWQARNDMKANTGNKGIIEEIDKKPLNLIFESDIIKNQILYAENHFKTGFIVDVKVQTANEKPVAYKITRLHESFLIEDGN